ncbi:hypothetical protein BS78_09G009000 [Paspalum vaginatum]|nr:hypothetical protein BS78_09G009000 [Paspalum vaginatum]
MPGASQIVRRKGEREPPPPVRLRRACLRRANESLAAEPTFRLSNPYSLRPPWPPSPPPPPPRALTETGERASCWTSEPTAPTDGTPPPSGPGRATAIPSSCRPTDTKIRTWRPKSSPPTPTSCSSDSPSTPWASMTSKYFNDYFVYTSRPQHQHPTLDLLPHPPAPISDTALAVLGCAGAGGDNDGRQYVVAALSCMFESTSKAKLHLYRSSSFSKPAGRRTWTSQAVSVEEPVRNRVCPTPSTADRFIFHKTTKAIVIGGAKGTVGWVDLWRGILFCDVLDDSPKLRDLPLPNPAASNWRRFLRNNEPSCRDITINQSNDSIKFVEMEIFPPIKKKEVASSKRQSDSYLEGGEILAPGSWRITMWSMPAPFQFASFEDWHLDCTTEQGDLRVDDPRHYELLHKLAMSSSDIQEETWETMSLGCLRMAIPTLSIHGDVVHLICKADFYGNMGAVVTVDLREKKLQGVAKLDRKKNIRLLRCFLACEIYNHHLRTR